MPATDQTALVRRLPSMKALLFFNTVGKHLNLVRAGQELHLTQGALSRQLKALEEHLGVDLFKRGPRGLAFTQEGETLYAYSQRAFELLGSGLRRISVVADRETLVVSVARSFALRVLSRRLRAFMEAYPFVDLQIDTHRYSADLESSGADISIRLSFSEPGAYRVHALTDDVLWTVAQPSMARRLRGAARAGRSAPAKLLVYSERDDWEAWVRAGNIAIQPEAHALRVGDSATLIELVENGAGFCLTRACLVQEAIREGRLARIDTTEIRDGQRYRAVCGPRSGAKRGVNLFFDWLANEFGEEGVRPP